MSTCRLNPTDPLTSLPCVQLSDAYLLRGWIFAIALPVSPTGISELTRVKTLDRVIWSSVHTRTCDSAVGPRDRMTRVYDDTGIDVDSCICRVFCLI